MNCKGVQRLLSAYIDRELSGDEMLTIRAHLGVCDECRREAEDLRDLKRLLSGIEAPEPSAGFEDRLAATVLHHSSNERPQAGWGRSTVILAGVAACSMAATFAAVSGSHAFRTPAASNGNSIAFEIQRDQARSFAADPYGAPVITASAVYGR